MPGPARNAAGTALQQAEHPTGDKRISRETTKYGNYQLKSGFNTSEEGASACPRRALPSEAPHTSRLFILT